MASQVTSAPAKTNRYESYVDDQLEKTRARIKIVDLCTGIFALVGWTLAVLLFFTIIDSWVWTLGTFGRILALVVLLGGIGAIAVFYIAPLFLRKINPKYAARMIEQARPKFKNSILNYLWTKSTGKNVNSAVAVELSQQAASDISEVTATESVDQTNLIRTGFVVVGLAVFVVGYCILSPKSPIPTLTRVLSPFSDISRPAIVRVTSVTPGNTEVFFGDTLPVTAEIRGSHEPEDVQLIYSTDDGQHTNVPIPMNADGPFRYEVELKTSGTGIQQNLKYKIVARDGESPWYSVKVKPQPAVLINSLKLVPPKYTELAERIITGTGEVDGVEGTRVFIEAAANLPIQNAYIEFLKPDRSDPDNLVVVKTEEVGFTDKDISGSFLLTLNAERDGPFCTHYQIRYQSSDGDLNSKPNIYPIRITPDFAPEIDILEPRSTEILLPVNGTLAIQVEATDVDYEISGMGLQLANQGIRILNHEFEIPQNDRQRVRQTYWLVPEKLSLEPGDKATFFATADDNRHSPYGELLDPNRTRSENFTITITEADSGIDEKKRDEEIERAEKEQQQNNQDQDETNQENQQEGNQDNESSSQQEQSGTDDGTQDSDQNTDESDQDGNDEQGSSDGTSDPTENNDPNTDESNDDNSSGGNSESNTNSQDSENSSNPEDDQNQNDGAGTDPEQRNQSEQGNGSETQEGNQGDSSQEGSGQGRNEAADQGTQQNPSNSSGNPNQGTPENPSASDDAEGQQNDAQGDGQRDNNLQDGSIREDAPEGERIEELMKYINDRNKENQSDSNDSSENNNRNQEDSPNQNDRNPSNNESAPNNDQNTDSANPNNQTGDEKDPSDQRGSGDNRNEERDPSGSDHDQNNTGNSNSDNTNEQNPKSNQQTPSNQQSSTDSENSTNDQQGDQSSENNSNDSSTENPSENQGQESSEQDSSNNQETTGNQQQTGNETDPTESGQSNEGDGQSENAGDQGSGDEGSSNQSSSSNSNSSNSTGQPGSSADSESSQSSGNNSGQGATDFGQSSSGNPADAPPPNNNSDAPAPNDREFEQAKRERENIEHAKKAAELVLDELKRQSANPDPELLERLNWTPEELREFLDSWEQMKKAAETGGTREKRRYESRLKSLGLKPNTPNTRRLEGDRDGMFDLSEEGATNRPPADWSERYKRFQRLRNRAERD